MFVEKLRLWSKHIYLSVPVVLLPVMIALTNKPTLCAYVMVWMAFYWITELLPLPVTSLMPLVLFPLLDILSTEETAEFYFNDLGNVVIGSLMVVLGVQKTGLARRMGLRILYFVGTSSSKLLFVFMVTCASLSMWLPNTSVTALVAPVAMAVIEQMRFTTKIKKRSLTRQSSLNTSPVHSVAYQRAFDAIRISLCGLSDDLIVQLQKEMLLCTAYSASIGGVATLTGTFPNLILKDLYEHRFPDAPRITNLSWMAANAPAMIICLMLAWCCGNERIKHISREQEKELQAAEEKVQREITRRYGELGPITTQEVLTEVLVFILCITWINLPREDVRWHEPYAEHAHTIGLGLPALLAGMMMFVMPRHKQRLNPKLSAVYSPWKPVLTWRESGAECHWGLMFLICGALTFSKASQESGLSGAFTRWLDALQGLNTSLVLTLLCLISAALTEVFSNSAVAAIMLPVVLETAVKLQVHPLYFGMPVALSCSLSFMLPSATPSNAIVFQMAEIPAGAVIWHGMFLTTLCVSVVIIFTSTWARFMLHLDHFPVWAMDNATYFRNSTGNSSENETSFIGYFQL